MSKILNFLMIILLLLVLTFFYTYFLINSNLLVEDYNSYKDNPPCEMKILENGFTQLDNCAKYKLKDREPAEIKFYGEIK